MSGDICSSSNGPVVSFPGSLGAALQRGEPGNKANDSYLCHPHGKIRGALLHAPLVLHGQTQPPTGRVWSTDVDEFVPFPWGVGSGHARLHAPYHPEELCGAPLDATQHPEELCTMDK